VKPLAEHGTTARAKGRPSAGIPGCPCPPCRNAENAYDKRRRFLNQTGRTLRVDTAPVAAHLRGLFAAGAGWTQLAAISDCSTSTIHNLLAEKNPQCRRTTANKILAIQPGDAIPEHRGVPAIGTIRRIRALMAQAHTCKAISASCRIDHSTVTDLLVGRSDVVTLGLANRVADGYRALSRSSGTSTRSLNRARREGWAPPAAWDDDTIGDPDAHPDWTGYCGTDRGWWTHKRQQLPICPRCEQAHQEWLAERADLHPQLRNQEMFRARAEASQREADLAADARELLGYGVGIEQVAARLGVTRQHLQQAMLRHPAEAVAA
jgi:lambda repressor-like predicted transcriptional regulator